MQKIFLKYLDCKHIEHLNLSTIKVKPTCPRSYLGNQGKLPSRVISITQCNECCGYSAREDGQLNTFNDERSF